MDSPINPLIDRLRELALVNPTALLAGAAPTDIESLKAAFVGDLLAALAEAEAAAKKLLAKLSRGQRSWAFARAAPRARQAAGPEQRQAWQGDLDSNATVAHELARLFSAARPLIEVLARAEAMTPSR